MARLWFVLGCCLLTGILSARPPIICRDPDVGGTTQNSDRKFLIFGTDDNSLAGMGNQLIFFPAAFYFAALTGRDLLISDHSVLGEVCRILYCGFPFVEKLAAAFPKILSPEAVAQAQVLKFQNFIEYMEGRREIESKVVRATGYLSKSDWWVWLNETVPCVSRITGCDPGDVMCAERHAYQRLIRGPFRASFSEKEEERIRGVPDYFKHALLTLPHSYSPRLDIAVHLRAQFYHFEQQTKVDDPAYRKEVDDWLASSERQEVFTALQNHVITHASNLLKQKALRNDSDPIYIYLAADNEDVKDAFVSSLMNRTDYPSSTEIMRLKSQSIYHVKNLPHFKKMTNGEGLLDLIFDWYALSLANEIYAWRKGGTSMVSTFVHSAQKLSGTTERTDMYNRKGTGSAGFQLIRDKRGRLHFDFFWGYPFLEDYATPPKHH